MLALRISVLRPVGDVPWRFRWLLLAMLAAQLAWHGAQQPPQARAEALPAAPAPELLSALSLGEPAVLSRLLSLWLQAFDNQPGISVPYVELDFERVSGWLVAALRLDPRNSYPLLAATHLYAAVPDPHRVRRMLALVESEFKRDPVGRWRWMAHGALIAKHGLRDGPLALALARQLTERTRPGTVPAWARQMQVFLLEDLGEYDAAAVLLGGLLESGEVNSEREQRFLLQRLERLRQAR